MASAPRLEVQLKTLLVDMCLMRSDRTCKASGRMGDDESFDISSRCVSVCDGGEVDRCRKVTPT
jgi:hypothetical protein